MSPMPRAGRKATLALAVSLASVMAFLAVVGAPVHAQDAGGETGQGAAGGEGNATGQPGGSPPRTFVVRALDDGCDGEAPCWDIDTLVVRPGDQVRVLADFSPSAAPHNFQVGAPIGRQVPERGAVAGGVHEMTFTLPEDMSGEITFVCTVHPNTMRGNFVTPDSLASAGDHVEVHHLGVHFLAYWVGVIAFAILFVVYGITFFLFKYNETSATTDHWDRSGAETPSRARRYGVNALLLALTIAIAAAAAMIILALRSDITGLNGEIASLQTQVASLTKELAAAKQG